MYDNDDYLEFCYSMGTHGDHETWWQFHEMQLEQARIENELRKARIQAMKDAAQLANIR